MNAIDRVTKFRLTCDVETEQVVRHFYCGHEYVEIGGIKWATMNVGANSVTDYGLYFQWGDTQGYTADQVGRGEGKKYFGSTDYKYCDCTSSVITKYNNVDCKKVLDAEDDAVTAAWGGNWRMPTSDEFKALGNAVNVVWTEDYQGSGVHGFVCTDESDSSKVLFFPAAGFNNGSVHLADDYGRYWSSSIGIYVNTAHDLLFRSNKTNWGCGYRCCGYSVRGVVN